MCSRRNVCVKIQFNSNFVVLQSCSGLHIIFYKLKRTYLFFTDHCKKLYHNLINMFFSENENNYVRIVILSDIEKSYRSCNISPINRN